MPKRLIDSAFLNSPSMEALSPGAQDAFPRFILLCDDFGCFEIDADNLRVLGWPKRKDVSAEQIAGWLYEYATKTAPGEPPVAMTWTERGRRYCHLTGWFGDHGQRKRDEYHPETNRHGSKRRTPPPPGELLSAVMAGKRRAADGLPPGSDIFPPGNPRETNTAIPNEITPAREIAGAADFPRVPAAIPADADADATAVLPKKTSGTDPRFAPLRVAWEAEFKQARGTAYRWQGAKDSKALHSLLAVSVGEFVARARRALSAAGFANCSTVAELAMKWNHHATAPPQPKQSRPDPSQMDYTKLVPM